MNLKLTTTSFFFSALTEYMGIYDKLYVDLHNDNLLIIYMEDVNGCKRNYKRTKLRSQFYVQLVLSL